jgi:hypothetical protein
MSLRPSRRSWFSRITSHTAFRDDLKVVRMPTSEYKRHFARDKSRKYIGTEPERSWTAPELDRKYGCHQQAVELQEQTQSWDRVEDLILRIGR